MESINVSRQAGNGLSGTLRTFLTGREKCGVAPPTALLLRGEGPNLRGSSATGALLRVWIAAR